MQDPMVAIAMDVDALREGFTHPCFERPSASGETLFYYLSWQPSLLDGRAVIRIHGVLRGRQKQLPPLPFPSFDQAWHCLRAIIRRRLREGCTIVDPSPCGCP